jgi:peptide/nickel transport system substrate-binding protein
MIYGTTRSGWVRVGARHRRAAGLLAVALVALMSAAGAQAIRSGSTAKPVLRFAEQFVNACCNPTGGDFGGSLGFAYAPLTHLNNDGSISPGLATSWRYVPEPAGSGMANKVFELTLRTNARFSDGSSVTAAAVRTWLLSPGVANLPAQIGPIQRITTSGKWTVRLYLKTPNPDLPWVLSQAPGLVTSPRALAASSSYLSNHTDGAGPYVLLPSETVVGSQYTFIPNKFYYDKSKIHWGKVVVTQINDPTSTLQAMQTGQIDVAVGTPETADAAKAAGFGVATIPSDVRTFFTGTNGATGKPAAPQLTDVRVRQALNYALDRKAISATAYGKYGSATSSWASQEVKLTPDLRNYYPYNPKKAKALLAAAGYPSGFTITLGAFGGDASVQTLLPLIAKYFAAVGVKSDIIISPTIGDYGANLGAAKLGYWLAGVQTSQPILAFWSFVEAAKLVGFDDPVAKSLWLNGARAANGAAYARKLIERATSQAFNLPVTVQLRPWLFDKRVGGLVSNAGTRGNPDPTEWFPRQ